MIINRGFAIGAAAIASGWAEPAMAQSCTREGDAVTCNDGRHGIWSGDAIIWPDGTRSSLTPHPSVIIGNKSSVVVAQGVFVGQGKGVAPLDNPSSPYKLRCAVLDGVSYCN
jgi:hypothetical protein